MVSISIKLQRIATLLQKLMQLWLIIKDIAYQNIYKISTEH